MKTKIIPRKVKALYTTNPGEIARIITEADTLTLPDNLLKTAADLAATVIENTPNREFTYSVAAPLASYLLKYAYILNQSGELVTAPPPKPRPKKEKEGAV